MIMASNKAMLLSAFLFFFFLAGQQEAFAAKKSYVVYLGGHNHGPEISLDDLDRVTNSHHDLLASILGSKEAAKEAIIYSYKRRINGFSASLEEEDAEKIARHPEVISVFPNKGRSLHTSHSWSFMNLEDANGEVPDDSLWSRADFGRDVIIANLDTGVWPESESFNDHGFSPIPSKWKGSCQNSSVVPCNKKLIGARYFNKIYLEAEPNVSLSPDMYSARDFEGHGTHTLSTAGGSFVTNATIFGVPLGTTKGGSPAARVAAYKICWPSKVGGCYDGDSLAAFDQAIHDGVDVISLSVGGAPGDYFNDGLAIGAFHAFQNNVVVVASAGNSGPLPGTVSNVAPWFITVAASTIDRRFQSNVQLPNGILIKGASFSKAKTEKKFYPLIYAALAKNANSSVKDAERCFPNTLDQEKVKGKILVCLRGESARVEKGYVAAEAGAVGMILCNDAASGNEIVADLHVLPATQITYHDSLPLLSYMNSNKEPKAYLQPPEILFETKPDPQLAAFSSRGPNVINPEIIKPDITAPGLNIIASYPQAASPTDIPQDRRQTSFIIMSGTSMSCPHVSGVVGLLKSLHPDWSPAAIKSAIMTTGRTRDNTKNPMKDLSNNKKSNTFGYGAGHIRPNRAMDPGLVYDLTVNDHLNFLCGNGYNETLIRRIVDKSYKCPKEFNLHDFNYPSISVTNLEPHKQVVVKRTLKNVGLPGTYIARLRNPAGVSVTVNPNMLTFGRYGEEQSFNLTIKAGKSQEHHNASHHEFGELLWTDGKHYVRSPVAISFATKKEYIRENH